MKIKHILFDLDGTLTDPKHGITRSLQYAMEKLGEPVPAADDLLWIIGPPLQESLKKILGANAHKAETALSFYQERYKAVGKFECGIYPGIPETLTALNQQGYNLFVATSKPYVFANEIIAHFDLLRFFKGVYGSELDGTRANKGDLIAYILKKEAISAQNTMMVGDRCHDMMGAKKHGVYTLGVTYGYGSKEELVGSNADYIADSPQEIREIMFSTNS